MYNTLLSLKSLLSEHYCSVQLSIAMQNGVLLVIVALLAMGVAHTTNHFLIKDQMIEDLQTKVLWNTATGEYVQIITDLGGRVEDLVLMDPSQQTLRSVLLTHNKNATEIKENTWWKNAILFPYANRINGVSVFFKNLKLLLFRQQFTKFLSLAIKHT